MRDKPVELYNFGNRCKTCYCTVDQPWYGKMSIHPQEIGHFMDIKETFPANVRFSCSIEIEGWMEEMIVRVPTRRTYGFQMSDTHDPNS